MAPWAAKGATLVAPAIMQGEEGMNWLKEFLRACPEEECHIGGLNLHCELMPAQLRRVKLKPGDPSRVREAHQARRSARHGQVCLRRRRDRLARRRQEAAHLADRVRAH